MSKAEFPRQDFFLTLPGQLSNSPTFPGARFTKYRTTILDYLMIMPVTIDRRWTSNLPDISRKTTKGMIYVQNRKIVEDSARKLPYDIFP